MQDGQHKCFGVEQCFFLFCQKNQFCSTLAKQLRSVLVDFYSVDACQKPRYDCWVTLMPCNWQKHFQIFHIDLLTLVGCSRKLMAYLLCLHFQTIWNQLVSYLPMYLVLQTICQTYDYAKEICICMLSLLKSVERRMSEFESTMVVITRDVRALQVWPPLPGHSLPPTAVQPTSRTLDINTTKSFGQRILRYTGTTLLNHLPNNFLITLHPNPFGIS